MKRLLRALISVVLCISLTLPAAVVSFAADGDGSIDAISQFDAVSNELIVSGSVASAKGNIPLIMTVKTANGELVGYLETVSGSSVDGKCAFAFDGVPFSADAASAEYTVYISADFVRTEKTFVYSYKGIDGKYNALSDIASSDTKDKMVNAIENNFEIIGLSAEKVAEISNSQKLIMAEMLMAVTYNCPDDYTSNENIKVILSEITKAAKIVKDATVVIDVCNFKTADDVKAWLTNYADEYGFYSDNADTKYNDAEAAKYFSDVNLSTKLVSGIASKAQAARSVNKVIEIMHSEAVLEMIASSNNYKVKEIIAKLYDMFGINNTAFLKLSDSQKLKVYGAVSGVSYNKPEDFGSAVNELTDKLLKDSSKGAGGGTPSGGSPIGGKIQNGAGADEAEVTNQIYITFADIEDFDWAREAIEGLFRRGIVSGKDSTHFAPNDLVTRAEFSKMAVEALKLNLVDKSSGFTDVDDDSWYAAYVATARENGIVNGDGTMFNPDGAITREDIAAILYRAMGSEETDRKNVFNDYNSISDYAKGAVVSLYEAGVINGNGNGLFEPKKNASRAEAAKMIYLALCNN